MAENDAESKSQGIEEEQTPDVDQTEGHAEPEGGPDRREQVFLEERFTQLRPRAPDDTLGPPVAEPPPTAPPADRGAPDREAPLPQDFRGTRISEYREKQRSKQEREAPEQPDSLGEPTAGVALPPEAPAPPPATNWIPIGPSVLRKGQGGTLPGVSGRAPGIAVAPGGARVYVGAANGGVWRSTDIGRRWFSLMEAWDRNPTQRASDSLSVGALALVPGASAAMDRIYVGSGEAHGGTGSMFGVGPVVSFDGGANWATENVSPGSDALAGSGFYALALDPADADRVVAATRRGLYRREPDGAGGFHWDQKAVGGIRDQRVTSVVSARAGGITTFFAARESGPVYTSPDGATWATVGTGFPTTDVRRITLAVQPGNRDVVYALVSRDTNSHLRGVYRLDVGDGTWHQVTGVPATLFGPDLTQGGQGWYDQAMAVAPNDVDRIYVGGSTASSAGEWSGSLYRCEVTVTTAGGSITGCSAADTFIGGSVHADIHAIVFAPGDAGSLWVGCDGGVFHTTTPLGAGNIFAARNTGLATLTLNHLAQHPTEDAVIFCGSQDNGGERFTGEEAWLHSVWGDCGYYVIDWSDPYRVLATYTYDYVNRATDGGTRYNYVSANVPVPSSEPTLFYAPLVGTPPNPGVPAEADIAAFGSLRPWVTNNFGTSWASIPNGTAAGDSLVGPIRSMVFAAADKLYAGTYVGWAWAGSWQWYSDGAVYRFDEAGGSWSRTRLDTMGGANQLGLDGPVTDIAVDHADAAGNSIYITFGGAGDYRHVWHFDGTDWEQRSGPSAGHADSLLDVQHNAIVVDPNNTSHVYVGSDIGVWRSTDGGATWETYSEGLPDASVMDLKLHNPRRLLRASTHGRSVYEREIDAAAAQGVELYVRDTQLDQGRHTTVNWLDDPTDHGEVVRHWAGPDIKLDTPDALGDYQFPLTGDIDFFEFVETLSDDARNVATHATATITTRVYVQVHNRGVIPADNVQVMLLLSNASAGLPALPANYHVNVQTGTPISTADWETVGIVSLDDVRVGAPKIAAFDLTSDMLPPPASLAGNDHHCVLALLHHADDPYTSTTTHTDNNSRQERKAAHKNLKVVQFIGTLPAPPPMMAVRISNAALDAVLLTKLMLRFSDYPGTIRLFLPEMHLEGDLADLVDGAQVGEDFEEFRAWAEKHAVEIERALHSVHPYNKQWTMQRLEDLERVLAFDRMLVARGPKQVSLDQIIMEPNSAHTVFLMFDRPDARIGDTFDLDILQEDVQKEDVIGGMSVRIEMVPEPKIPERYRLKLWTHQWLRRYTVVRAKLTGPFGDPVGGDDAKVLLYERSEEGTRKVGWMRWHRSWRSFFAFLRGIHKRTFVAVAYVDEVAVAKAEVRV